MLEENGKYLAEVYNITRTKGQFITTVKKDEIWSTFTDVQLGQVWDALDRLSEIMFKYGV